MQDVHSGFEDPLQSINHSIEFIVRARCDFTISSQYISVSGQWYIVRGVFEDSSIINCNCLATAHQSNIVDSGFVNAADTQEDALSDVKCTILQELHCC